jgi:hypothetical protein
MSPTAWVHAILATFLKAVKRCKTDARRITATSPLRAINVRALAEEHFGSFHQGF